MNDISNNKGEIVVFQQDDTNRLEFKTMKVGQVSA